MKALKSLRHLCMPLVACAALGAAVSSEAAERPNLVFIFTDQHSWDMLGCYGNADVQTPNIDRFAAQGIRFNHCIATSPVCTPYRGMLLSGMHSLRNNTFENDRRMTAGNGNYFAEVLRDAGYRTGYYGKWHLYGGDRNRGIPAGPYRYGFDHEFLSNNCTLVYDAARAYYWCQEGETRLMYGDWEPYAQTRQAMQFIDQHADAPFALFVSWHPPHNWGSAHAEYSAPEELLALYDPEKLTLRPTTEDTPRNRMAYQGHLAMITGIDQAFGWIMDKLEERGVSENTIVVFTSDHGDMLHSHGWPNNKGRAEHTSLRVPLLVRWPQKLQPGESDMLIGTLDLMPTLLAMMQLPIPETCDGRDASEAIIQGRDDGTDALPIFFHPLNWRGVYTHRYTYSEAFYEGAETRPPNADTFTVLYDRQSDPWEQHNLFGHPSVADIQAELRARTQSFMQQFGDKGLEFRALSREQAYRARQRVE
jgi:arylsulfatase A-like enzyme